jgi:acetyl esterase/lipase
MPSDQTPSGPQASTHEPDRMWTYKTVGGFELKAHVFLPKDAGRRGRRAVFVFFHPGGWNMGEPAWGYDFCHRYARSGMVAISFQYRLSSVGYTPVDALSDVRSAIRWTRQNADVLGTDGSRLAACGVSAGAHLALCATMLSGPDDPGDDLTFSPVPNALALQCAPVNTALSSQFIELLQGKYASDDYTPACHIRPGLPPMCFVQGTADEIVPYDSVREFVEKMKRAGNACELHTLEGTDHFFTRKADQREGLERVDDFLAGLGYVVKEAGS